MISEVETFRMINNWHEHYTLRIINGSLPLQLSVIGATKKFIDITSAILALLTVFVNWLTVSSVYLKLIFNNDKNILKLMLTFIIKLLLLV